MRGHIIKRGNKYAIVVDLGRDHQNKRKQKWFSGYQKKRDAERDLPGILAEIETGTYVEPPDMTIKEYMDIWLKKKEKEVAYGTYFHYENYVRKYIVPGLGRWKIKQIKPMQVESFIDSLSNTKLSERSRHHVYRILSSSLKYGTKYGIKQNLMNDVSPPRVKRKHMPYWTEKDISIFLPYLRKERYFITVYLALTTGMRQGETLGLRWSDIDFDKKVISVRQQLRKKKDKDENGTYELTAQLKSESSCRTIHLDDNTISELKKHRNNQLKEKVKCGKDYREYDLVTATVTGNYVLPSNLNRSYWRAIERSKVKHITFHALRHTHATLMLTQGTHPKIVQERLGHSSIQMTLDKYSHVIPSMQQAAAEKFGDLFTDESNKNSMEK
ncbi:tyrosine-type recombinase/integrase [Paraliobacillus sediminis]|uniref:tyrosine-type recombinase/integrase n=1 Tax=Paraliobacillus sediminis TaxID=1885916 RepID=UPI000E3EA96B|nr:site-specific integrase [Paraliobacillus sediminis]